jgi:hypothetical protein
VPRASARDLSSNTPDRTCPCHGRFCLLILLITYHNNRSNTCSALPTFGPSSTARSNTTRTSHNSLVSSALYCSHLYIEAIENQYTELQYLRPSPYSVQFAGMFCRNRRHFLLPPSVHEILFRDRLRDTGRIIISTSMHSGYLPFNETVKK